MKPDYIERAQEALKIHTFRRTQVPELVVRILSDEKWKKRDPDPNELKLREFEFFPEFVEAPRPWGLQVSFKELEDLCKGFTEVELALSKEKSKKGKEINNAELKTIRKTDKQKGLELLERERPDLLKKVSTGEISVYGAMVEGGYLKERVKVEKTPEGFANYIRGHFSEKQRQALVKLLQAK